MKKTFHIYVLSACIAALALAMVYLAVVLNGVNGHAPELIQEVKNIQESLPEVLEVAEGIRVEIPEHLDRLEALLERTEEAGQQAGEGAVTGIFTGTLKAPFSLLGALVDSLPGTSNLSRKERDVIAYTMDKLLRTRQPGTTYPFESKASGMTGAIELVEVDADQEPPRYLVGIEASKKGKLLFRRTLVLQRGAKDNWQVIESNED